jgi:hypothetical protein
MARETFVNVNFKAKALETIRQANEIIAEYMAAGFTLTLRQLYYQFVARGLLANKQTNYDNLGKVIADARNAGFIDWKAIEDRTRFLRGHTTYKNPADAIEHAREDYRINMWEGQERRIEVWIEKDALLGVIEQVCNKWDINYFACRGYASQSELYMAGKRILWNRRKLNQDIFVLHLGDHDPSGMDMTRDNEDRLSLYAGGPVEVRRIALNMNQVDEYNPPPNPTKLTDCRANKYIEDYGMECWELDALDPTVIANLIEEQVESELNHEQWQRRQERFEKDIEMLDKAVDYVGQIGQETEEDG